MHSQRVLTTLSPQQVANCYARLRPSFAYDSFEAYESAQDSVRQAVQAFMAADPQMEQDLTQAGDWLKVVVSPDRRLRICSWDERSGGTMHDMCVLAQIRLSSGEIMYQRLDPPPGDPGPLYDVMFLELYQLPSPTGPRYLAIGLGAYGSGHHHRVARLFVLGEQGLHDVPHAFGDSVSLTVLFSHGESTFLQYDPEQRVLTHPEMREEPSMGRQYPTGRTLHWQYQQGRFVRNL